MMSWRASAPANTAGVWNGRPASESTTRNHRATVSPASRPPTAPCPIRSLMAGLIVPSARTTRTQYHAAPRAAPRRCFVARLATIMRLHVPATPRADPLSSPMLQADRLTVPDVIVVEDDPALAELLEYGLRSRAYRFASYRNGREALTDL